MSPYDLRTCQHCSKKYVKPYSGGDRLCMDCLMELVLGPS